MAKSFKLHDWNDARLLIVCAEKGSFAAAGDALGLDQTTVSRRIANLEHDLGRPLFHRRRSGAALTVAGAALLSRAQVMASGAAQIEQAISGLQPLPPPIVTVAATAGLIEFTLKPALAGLHRVEFPIDRRSMTDGLPSIAFTSDFQNADIAIRATDPNQLPRGSGRVRVRGAGRMRFVPVAARRLLKEYGSPANFDALVDFPLIDIAIYHPVHGLDPWNEVAGRAPRSRIFPTTPPAVGPVLTGEGITILGPYAAHFDPRLVVIEIPAPYMAVSLWITAHEDTLREPAVRRVYDLLAGAFHASPFFRNG